LTLLANSLPRGDQRRKGGDVGFCGLGMSEPGHHTFQIDANRNQNVLEMSLVVSLQRAANSRYLKTGYNTLISARI